MDAPSKLTGSGRRVARLTWNEEMRHALHLLYTEFDFATGSKLFYELFKDHIRACGCGLWSITDKMMRAQYRERKRDGREGLWVNVLQPEPARKATMMSRIRMVAARMDANEGDRHPAERLDLLRTRNESPAKAKRKRSAFRSPEHAVDDDNAEDFDSIEASPRKLLKHFSAATTTSSEIQATEFERIARAEMTRTAVIKRRNGKDIWTTPEKYALAIQPYVPPPDQDVHPTIPYPGLLLLVEPFLCLGQLLTLSPICISRYWREQHSGPGIDTRAGFIVSTLGYKPYLKQATSYNCKVRQLADLCPALLQAGRYHHSNVVWATPPRSENVDPADLFNHFNRQLVASPFISVSMSLQW